MKAGWKTKTFEDCICKVSYISKVQRKDFLPVGEYPIISQECEYINGRWNDKTDLFVVTTPVVIFGDHTKVFKYVDFDFVLGADGVKILQPKDFLVPKFFYYQLQTANLDSLGYARHYKLLKALDIVHPSVPEQERIVGILDKALEAIATAKANAEQNLQNARALFESQLEEVFSERGEGWVKKSLSDLCQISSSLVDPRSPGHQDMLHVGGANIASKIGKLLDLKTSKDEGLISGKFSFDESMVLYSKIRPYLMKVARPNFSGLCSADIYPLSPIKNEIDRDFLFYLLLSPEFTAYAIAGSARAGMPKVNRDHLFAFSVYLPSVEEQKKLAARLDSLHFETQRLQGIYEQKVVALETLRKSLLNQAFSGQLRA